MIHDKNYSYCFDPQECKKCQGRCCIGESGYIWINKIEMQKLADFLFISVEELEKTYLFKIKYRYSIKEKPFLDGFACVFFDENKRQCSIYEARPSQCRSFPFWEYFKTHTNEVIEECPGIRLL